MTVPRGTDARPRSEALDAVVLSALATLADLPGVARVGIALTEGGGRRLQFAASDRDPTADGRIDWCLIDAYDDVPLTAVVRTGEPVVGGLASLAGHFADLVERQRREGVAALAALPLLVAGAPIGGMVLFYDVPQAFADPQRAELGRRADALALEARRAQTTLPRPRHAGGAEPAEGTWSVRVDVEADARGVALARRLIRRRLSEWGLVDDVVDDAVLCVSELVTNAVIHTSSPSDVQATLDGSVLTVTVRDQGAGGGETRHVRRDEPLAVHGRGLQLVEALSSRWGSELDDTGTTVWFMLEVG